jgi:ABC-type Fe3+-hydroxamate transport system substrate-binding protein
VETKQRLRAAAFGLMLVVATLLAAGFFAACGTTSSQPGSVPQTVTDDYGNTATWVTTKATSS